MNSLIANRAPIGIQIHVVSLYMCFKKVKEAKLEEQHLASPFYILLVCLGGDLGKWGV